MTSTTGTTTSPVPTSHDQALAERLRVPVVLGSAFVTVLLAFLRADSPGESISMAALQVVVAAVLLLVVVPRGLAHTTPGWGRVAMSVLAALLVVPAFWSGLPLLLGTSGALLGSAARRAPAGSGRGIAALVVGTLAVVAYVAIYVVDWIANPSASWWQ